MKHAIVIGASSGIGREVSKLLIKEGWKVGIAARREALLEEIRTTSPDMVVAMPIDVTSDDAPNRLMELTAKLGGVSLYIHCSGIGKQNMGLDGDIEFATTKVNVTGFTRMIDTMFNYMAKNGGGHIVVVSSIAGTKGLGVAPAYSATKAFQNTYVQALEQLAGMRRLPIRFTDIRPGFVATPLLDGSGNYPMLMDKTAVARQIMRAIHAKKHVEVIDWRYKILVAMWKGIPNRLWRRLKIVNKKK